MAMFWILLSLVPLLRVNAELWSDPLHKALSDELIDYVNSIPNNTWRAARSTRFQTEADIRKVLGTIREPKNLKISRRPTVSHAELEIDLPEQFNSTEKWPECETIGHIADQSGCGSCWAVAAASAMSDRLCTVLRKPEYQNIQLSALDLLACCTNCGFGCVGGWPGEAWDYWRDVGLVTGGDYRDNETCLPYPFPPCDHNHTEPNPCPPKLYPTPKCVDACVNGSTEEYKLGKYKAATSYNVEPDERAIQKEIWLNGPVEASFTVYGDFAQYSHGIYRHVAGEIMGGHAVRMIGWGEENGVKYWIIANSWNSNWGEQGHFRIVRGENHCGIEEDVVAGLPLEKL